MKRFILTLAALAALAAAHPAAAACSNTKGFPAWDETANANCVRSVDTNGDPISPPTAAGQTSTNSKLDQLHSDLTSATPAGENFVGFVGGKTAIVGGSFNRPADTTAYASGDLVANSTTAGSVTPITVAACRVSDGSGAVRRVRLKTSSTSTTNAQFRVHFYKDSPTVTNGDNGAWLTAESNYLGAVDVTLDRVFSDAAKGLGAPLTGAEINFVCSSGTSNIFALIEARAAYTPTSGETFTLAVEVLQN